MKKARVTRHRSAITGQYVTADYARLNPTTTVAERDRPRGGVRARPSKKK